jgi:hypothetical protein
MHGGADKEAFSFFEIIHWKRRKIMADTIFNFDRYRVFYELGVSGYAEVAIFFYNGEQGSEVADAVFSQATPQPPEILPDGRLLARYPLASYPHVIDLLRKSGSLQFRMTGTVCYLETTTAQLVGAGS